LSETTIIRVLQLYTLVSSNYSSLKKVVTIVKYTLALLWQGHIHPPPPHTNNTSQEKHEVFINFRSEDTRNNFTSHLNGALKRLDIRTYIDHDLNSGDEIPTTLVRAIEEAKLSVIVFSKNYAVSKWCLEELMKILEFKKLKGQVVVPVFYDVDPSDVRNQRGSYAEAFDKHERNFEKKI